MAAKGSELASISYNSQLSSAIGSVSITNQQDVIDATEIGNARRKYLPGIGSTTATCEIYYDQGDAACAAMETAANTNAAAQSLVITLTTNMTYSGNAYVTEFTPTASINDIIRANVTFQFTGTVTIA